MFGSWTGIPDRTTFTYTTAKQPVRAQSLAQQLKWDGDEDRLKMETVGPTGNKRRSDPDKAGPTRKKRNTATKWSRSFTIPGPTFPDG